MSNIFRVPVDHQHFKDTIEVGKPINEVEIFLFGEEKSKVERIARDGFVRFWGSLPGEANKRFFQRMQENDELLCYRSGNYIALAKIAFTTINPELAEFAWGVTENKTTWELIYFFKEVKIFEIDSLVVNESFGFGRGPVMGFSAISEDRVKEFVIKHKSLDSFISPYLQHSAITSIISQEIAKLQINSPHEAQFYLVDLGNQLNFDTYVPPSDAGRQAFGRKLEELITVRKADLIEYVAPKILDSLSNIDVIWFKENYKPQHFFEVIHRTGMSEAFGRLKTVSDYYENAKTKIIGAKETEQEFEKSKRLHFPNISQISYKDYDELISTHSEVLHFNQIVERFLN